MKKSFTFFCLILSFLSFSQKYSFDNQCEIFEKFVKGNYSNIPPRKIKFFYNSKDSSYIAYNFKSNEIRLFDFKLNSLKSLKLIETGNTARFDLISENDFTKFQDEIVIKKILIDDLGNDTYFIKTFSKEDSKRPNLEIKLKLRKSDIPFVRIHFMDLTENIHKMIYDKFLEKLPNQNYQIENVYLDYHNGVIIEDQISNCKNINLKFDLNFSPKN